jgi:hypothetical protein
MGYKHKIIKYFSLRKVTFACPFFRNWIPSSLNIQGPSTVITYNYLFRGGNIFPCHVAVLVPSVLKAANYLAKFGFQIGKEAEWDGEGTKEIYIERDRANALLLMEPIKPGAYQRAMFKRGPGLHHLAIDVLNLESYLESLVGSGWLLHPRSIRTIKQSQTAYLARPGFPALIEVQERNELNLRPLFVDEVSIPLTVAILKLAKYVGLEEIVKSNPEKTKLSLSGQVIILEDLF